MAAEITNHINAIIASVLSSSPDKSVPRPPIPIPDTLKGIDDLIHAGFEAYRNSCFNWLLAATGLVVVGLVMEGPELWHEITSIVSHWRFTRRFHFSLPESHVPNWAKLAAFVGWLFIIAGVAGEYVADSFVSRADGYVQTFDEILLTEARKESAHAETTAKGFDAQIAESKAKAKSAEATAKQFEATIAEAKRDAADSKQEAESERLARVQLQKELEPRRLTGKQKEQLRALLSDDPQQIMFGWCMNGSDDCQDFVNDIGEAFNKAGWKTLFSPSTQNKRGIYLGFAKGSDERLVAHWVPKLRNALSAVGLSSEQKWFDPSERTLSALGFEKNVLYLIVGQKPAIKTPTATNGNSE